MPVPTLRQPTDRLPHGPAGQLRPTLPQPDGLLPAAMPWRGRYPSPLLLGAQALPSLLGLCVCAAPGHGLVMLTTCLRLMPGWERGPGVPSPCQCGPGSSPPKPYLKQQAPGTRWRTWGETLTFALFGSTFGKEQVPLVLLEDAVVAFLLRNGLQRPADPGSHTPGSFPLNPPTPGTGTFSTSPPLPFVVFVCACQLCVQPGVITLKDGSEVKAVIESEEIYPNKHLCL
ncbi:interleukin 25, partial [Mus musculus]